MGKNEAKIKAQVPAELIADEKDVVLRPHVEIWDTRLLLPRQILAKAFGVSGDMVAKWDIKPVIKRGREALYYLPEVISYRQGNDGAPKLNPAQEKALLDQVRRQRAEIELRKEKGEITLITDVCNELEKELIGVRQKLLSIPNKLATELVPVDKPQAIQEILTNAIYEALEGLNYGGRITFKNTGNNIEDAKTAAEIKPSAVGGHLPTIIEGSI